MFSVSQLLVQGFVKDDLAGLELVNAACGQVVFLFPGKRCGQRLPLWDFSAELRGGHISGLHAITSRD